MEYPLAAIIAPDNVIQAISVQLGAVFPIPLDKGFSIILATPSFYDEVTRRFPHTTPYWHLSTALASLAEHCGVLGWMDAEYLDYFPLDAQIILWGIDRYPEATVDIPARVYPSPFYITLNAGLRLLGVVAEADKDEYLTLGLGGEGWDAAEVPNPYDEPLDDLSDGLTDE